MGESSRQLRSGCRGNGYGDCSEFWMQLVDGAVFLVERWNKHRPALDCIDWGWPWGLSRAKRCCASKLRLNALRSCVTARWKRSGQAASAHANQTLRRHRARGFEAIINNVAICKLLVARKAVNPHSPLRTEQSALPTTVESAQLKWPVSRRRNSRLFDSFTLDNHGRTADREREHCGSLRLGEAIRLETALRAGWQLKVHLA
jgi:hypothetical protein